MIYILILIALALLVAWLVSRKQSVITEQNNKRPDDCCGAHDVCENDSLLSANDTIEYYDDEELDSYKGILPDEYTDQAIEEFRDVLYTLKENEVTGWLKSMHLRCVELPSIIREEALMIVEERRAKS
jgi:hypothetical protein